LFAQPTFAAVQRPPQQPWPAAPQPPQLFALHAPKPGHIEPTAMQS
jgi:hypothetical protein